MKLPRNKVKIIGASKTREKIRNAGKTQKPIIITAPPCTVEELVKKFKISKKQIKKINKILKQINLSPIK